MKKIVLIGKPGARPMSTEELMELIENEQGVCAACREMLDAQMKPKACAEMSFGDMPAFHQMPPAKKNSQEESVRVQINPQMAKVKTLSLNKTDKTEVVPPFEMMAISRLVLIPDHIIKSGDFTHVFWKDGTKTTVKRHDSDVDDPEAAFAAAIVKKLYGPHKKVEKLLSGMTTKQRSGKEKENAKLLARARKEVSDRLFAEETYSDNTIDAIVEALEYLGFEEDEIPFFAILNKDSEFGRRVSNKLNGLDLAGVERIKEILDEHDIEVEITEEPADSSEDAVEAANEQEANADADKSEG